MSLKRIAVYLDEDEVTPQVSSLKQDLSDPALSNAQDKGLGLENASFEWNKVEVEKKDSEPSKVPETNAQSASSSLLDVSTIAGADSDESQDHRFELRDITVMFPEGQLSVITGPTARCVLCSPLGNFSPQSCHTAGKLRCWFVDGCSHSPRDLTQAP